MSLITLDFETPYRTRKNKFSEGDKFTLKSMTYEEYIRDPRFGVMGVGIKVDNNPAFFVRHGPGIRAVLEKYFFPGNTNILLAHNTPFDGAILSWYYGLEAGTYWDTMGMSNAIWPQQSAELGKLVQRLFPDNPEIRKGTELASYDGYWPEHMDDKDWSIYGDGYCVNDIDITFAAFSEMWKYFPPSELDTLDMTLKMFIHPEMVLDTERVAGYEASLIEDKKTKVAAAGVSASLLASNIKFTEFLKGEHGIEIPLIPSPTIKNPGNMKLALSKTDLEFIEIRKQNPQLNHIWDARIAIKSTGELNRCGRLLSHADPETNVIAVPLKYYGAHTGRWSGYNSVNFQNFKRGSPIRKSLYAPKGSVILVRDLANIEGRVNAWFNEQFDKCDKFANGIDLYNEIATDIFGYPVDRKQKVTDEQGNYLNAAGHIVADKDDAADVFFMEGFTGKTAELGLGYGMGPPKFRHQCAVIGDVLFEENFAKTVVKLWREKNYKIVAGWKAGDRAIFDMASRTGSSYQWRCLEVQRNRLVLPNGLALTYPSLKHTVEDGRNGFSFWEGKYYKNVYGGLLMENIIQALSRIILSGMMAKIDRRLREMGGRILLTVHDEIVGRCPTPLADEAYEYMGEVMSTPPDWANDGYLALSSAGGIADNYSK